MCSVCDFKGISFALAFLALLVSPWSASADEAPLNPIKLYHDVAATIRSTDSLSVHVEKQYDVVMLDGAKVRYSGALDMLVHGDKGLHMDYGDDVSAKEVWYDGSTLTIIDHLSNVYAQAPATGRVGDMLADVNERFNLELPLATLLGRTSAGTFEEYLESATYLGLHDVEGDPSHHVLYRGANADLQIWASTGDEPLLRKMVVTFWQIEGEPQQTLVFSDWNLKARTNARSFKARIPVDAVRTEFLLPLGASNEDK